MLSAVRGFMVGTPLLELAEVAYHQLSQQQGSNFMRHERNMKF